MEEDMALFQGHLKDEWLFMELVMGRRPGEQDGTRGLTEKTHKREVNEDLLEKISKILGKIPTSLICLPSLNMACGLVHSTMPSPIVLRPFSTVSLPSNHIFTVLKRILRALNEFCF